MALVTTTKPMETNHKWGLYFLGFHLRKISQEMTKISIIDMSFNITNLRSQLHLSGANESTVMLEDIIDDVYLTHDNVIKWKHFLRYWPFVRGIHQTPVDSPHKGQWRGGALMFSLICAWTNDWANNRGRWYETRSCSLWRQCNVLIRAHCPDISRGPVSI